MTKPYELVLDGPRKNALNLALMRSLVEQLDANEGRPLLLRGAMDGTFCAGVDLKEILSLDEAGIRTFLGLLDEVTRRLFTWPAPTVALVNGHAIAGGCVLALACDVRIASDDPRHRIGLTEVAVGVLFPPAVWQLMQYRIPAHARDRVLLGAEVHAPARAAQLGLVDEIAAPDQAALRARNLLRTMSTYDRGVYATTKAMLHGGVMDVDEEQTQRFLSEVAPAWTSPELRARILAFMGGGKR